MTIRFRATIVFEAEADTRDEATLILETLVPGAEVLSIGIDNGERNTPKAPLREFNVS